MTKRSFLMTLVQALSALHSLQAGQKPATVCHTGTLLDVQEQTEFVPTVQIVQVHRNKNSKDWTTVAQPSARKDTTYTVKVLLDGVIYTARSGGDFWNYKPSNMMVNTQLEACIEDRKLAITRPDGKIYRPSIIRREQQPPAPPLTRN